MTDLVLGVALETGYALAGDPAQPLPDTAVAFDRNRIRAALTTLESIGVHFLLLDDDLGPLQEGSRWIPRPDPTVFCSFVAQLCTRLGLVVTTQTAQLEPFHVAKHLQTVDNASHGRAGWNVRIGQSARPGRRRREPNSLQPSLRRSTSSRAPLTRRVRTTPT